MSLWAADYETSVGSGGGIRTPDTRIMISRGAILESFRFIPKRLIISDLVLESYRQASPPEPV